MTVIIYVGKFLLSIIYFFIKLVPTKNKVSFFSRQSDDIPIDFSLIIKELQKNNIQISTVISRQASSATGFFESFFKNISILFRQMYDLATSEAVIIDGYSIPVSILKHKKNLKIIQIWHSVASIKKFGLQTSDNWSGSKIKRNRALCMHKNYTYIISSSMETSKVYNEAMGTTLDNILHIGTPVLDYLYNNENKVISDTGLKNREKPKIAYIPTFREGKALELKELIDVFDFNKYDLIVSLHPLDNDTIIDERVITLPQYTSRQIISMSDCIISDYSSVIFEAGLQNKAVLFYVYDIDSYRDYPGLNIDPQLEYKKYSSRNPEDIVRMLDEEYDYSYLSSFIDKYVDCYDGKATERIISLLKS